MSNYEDNNNNSSAGGYGVSGRQRSLAPSRLTLMQQGNQGSRGDGNSYGVSMPCLIHQRVRLSCF